MDKPAGPTSHDVVDRVRRVLGIRRVGHAGTLDPFATGLLVVLIGPATRLQRYLVGLPKRYEGTLMLGVATDTGDPSGRPVAEDEAWRALGDEAIAQAMASLEGIREQRPPAYSAKKVQGVPAHRLARRGRGVELAPARVEIRSFRMTGRDGAQVGFEAEVGSGTYVRSLVVELGDVLGSAAHTAALRRTAVGPHRVEDACPPDAVAVDLLRPPLLAVGHLPSVSLDSESRVLVSHGRPLPAAGGQAGPVALLADGALVAVAEAADGVLSPRVVLSA